MHTSFGALRPLGHTIARFVVGGHTSLLLLAALLLAGCASYDTNDNDSARTPTTQSDSMPSKQEGNYITANPNPVPASAEERGKTTITWATKDIPAQQVHVYVSEEGGTESLFATAPEGSQEAPWISSDAPIEFKLYAGSGRDRKLLDKVVVTRSK